MLEKLSRQVTNKDVHEQSRPGKRVAEAYDYCHRITRGASRTFYLGSLLLPTHKRRAIWTVYALFRLVDDAIDEAMADQPQPGHISGVRDPRGELERWRTALDRLYRTGKTDDNPIMIAWQAMLVEYNVPLQPVLDLLTGVEMDLTQDRYDSFEDLSQYCYRVAGTVGIVSSSIFGYQDESALRYASNLGIALQLTNILRDIGEDARRGRIYLPQDEMQRFGYRESDLLAGTINESFTNLLLFQIERAEQYYQESLPGISLLDADCRFAVILSSMLYRDILQRIHLNNYDVFTRRAHVPFSGKVACLARAFWTLPTI
jgi:phytoene synthase